MLHTKEQSSLLFSAEPLGNRAQDCHFCTVRTNLKNSPKSDKNNRRWHASLLRPYLLHSPGAGILALFDFYHDKLLVSIYLLCKFCPLSKFNSIQYKSPYIITEFICI